MYGPIQLFVFGFDNAKVKKDLKNALLDLSKKGLIRILDIAYVSKSQEGNIKIREGTELDEVEQVKLGAAIGALIGLGAGGEEGMEAGMELGALKFSENDFGADTHELLKVAESLPPGSAGAILLIEHLWLKKFKEEFRNAGGTVLAQTYITPESLVALGMDLRMMAEAIEQEAVMEAEPTE
jgi:uncharacterized membrane protein